MTLPVTSLPADRPIVVVFSQSMDLGSIRAGETFQVEQVATNGSSLGAVSGRLEKNNQRIRFYPDQPWESGAFYRYTLASSTTRNDCANAVCSESGYPLQTDLLVDPGDERDEPSNVDIGGPDLAIYFEGADPVQTVFTPLRNLPIRDVNSNYVVDCPTRVTPPVLSRSSMRAMAAVDTNPLPMRRHLRYKIRPQRFWRGRRRQCRLQRR